MAEIVRTPGVLGGLPRLAGQRIGVHHVVGTLKACRDEAEAADWLAISSEAVRAAAAYAETHADMMAKVDREWEDSLECVREEPSTPRTWSHRRSRRLSWLNRC